MIQTFVRDLPSDTPLDTVERAERFLAEQATALRPDQLEKVANRCAVLINPDGKFSDIDRARRRGFTWSAQRADGRASASWSLPGAARQSRRVAGAIRGARRVQPGQ